jgi:hypothetical protein
VLSKSRDGELLARIATSLGVQVVRGSSSKGGSEALRGVLKAMRKSSGHPCVTMDGPRGPYHDIKNGVFYMGYHGNGWLVPIRVLYSSGKRFKSWDRFFLPLPFSRVRVVYETPYKLEAEELNADTLNREREVMLQKMNALDRYAFK